MRIRTGYSFHTAFGHIEDVMARLKEIGWSCAPITDRNSTFGFNRWAKLVQKNSLKPIFGVELAVAEKLGEKKPTVDFWTFVAIDDIAPLNDLIAVATANPAKDPLLTYAQALASPCIKIAGERLQLSVLPSLNGVSDFFFGLSPSTPRGLLRQVKEKGIQLAATADNFYPTKEQKEIYRVALGRRANTQTYPMHILSDDEWRAALPWVSFDDQKAAIQNRETLFARCSAKLKKAELLTPEKPKSLEQLCREGAMKLNCDLTNPVYSERLKKELDLIEEKKFEDYFFIIADLVGWAKQRMIVGPARGSSCGSLVCYLLGITTIDPIPFNLIFERFIDANRPDLPDIDIDFSDARRNLVFEYAEQKYGRERVARLGTVGMFKPRSALKQASAALAVPKWMTEKVLDGVIERSGGDSRALQQLEDTLKDTEAGRNLVAQFPEITIAGKMEGHPNNASQHAAGIVITKAPVKEYVAVDRTTNSVMCDKKDAEDLNLLKIDALGLTQLSVFERTLQLIGKPDVSGYLETIPLNDPKAFEVLNRGHFSGIFQFMGPSLKSITKQIVVKDIEDLVAITALARPGPLNSGGTNEWIKRRTGVSKASYYSDHFEPYLNNTLGIIVYQEQVMQICREIGGLSWADTNTLRRAMSKSMGIEFFDQFGDRFKAGAKKNGVPEEVLGKVWDDLCSYGSMGFNKAHAVAYGVVSYWCCWLKAHHPVEFAAATLDAESDPMRQIQLLRELAAEGVGYVPVDPLRSTDRWEIHDGKLIGPLTNIKGVGPATVAEVLNARKNGEPVRPAILKRLEKATTPIDSLYPLRAKIKEIVPDLALRNIHSEPMNILDVQPGIKGEVMVLAIADKIAPKDENELINVQKRGYKLNGPTAAINLWLADDTDVIFAKITRWKYKDLGVGVIERGRPKKSIYAVKGTVPKDFRMITVTNIRYLGDMEEEFVLEKPKGEAA